MEEEARQAKKRRQMTLNLRTTQMPRARLQRVATQLCGCDVTNKGKAQDVIPIDKERKEDR
jgi:hypothetical protein